MENKIDIVITWVDGNDKAWLEEKRKYVSLEEQKDKSTGGNDRYEDTNMLQYLFRGIEKFAPWVNKIFFVTWGHTPIWLNKNNPKLVIVNHKDFIPEKYLPTFNSATINLNLHRIPGLSEKFIYFNDDMFITKQIQPEMFFKKNLPCDMFVNDVVDTFNYHDNYNYTVVNDLCLLNKISNKKIFVRKHFNKVFSAKYGAKNLLKNFLLNKFNLFTGIIEPHLPASYLKSTYCEVWEKLNDQFDESCSGKVRNHFTCTENVIRYYQMTTGKFIPLNRTKLGSYTTSSSKNIEKLITNSKYKILCINYVKEKDAEKLKKSFDSILPDKSSFELE